MRWQRKTSRRRLHPLLGAVPAARGHGTSSARQEASAWAAGAVALFAATRRGTGALTEADLGRFVESFCKFHRCAFGRIPPQGELRHASGCGAAGPTRSSCFPASSVFAGPVSASLDPNSAVALGGAAEQNRQQQPKKRSHASARATSVQAPALDVAPGRIPGRHRLQPHRTAPAL